MHGKQAQIASLVAYQQVHGWSHELTDGMCAYPSTSVTSDAVLFRRHIRVKWFHDPTFPMLMDQCCVFTDHDLDKDGGLDLKSVRRRWGLSRTCKVL